MPENWQNPCRSPTYNTYIPISPDRSSKSYQVYTMLYAVNNHPRSRLTHIDIHSLNSTMLTTLQAWAIHWSRQQNRMSSDKFTVLPKIEYRLRQLSPCNPDTSRCPQKPTCGYNLRPCLYFCFWLEASGYQLFTRLLIPWVLWLSVLIQGFGPFSLGGKLLPPPRHRDPVSLSPNWPPPWEWRVFIHQNEWTGRKRESHPPAPSVAAPARVSSRTQLHH